MKDVFDGSDAFDARLAVLQRAGAPEAEVTAAIAVYERVRTAKAIAQALLPGATDAELVALAAAMGAAAQRPQGSRSAR